MTMQPQQTQQSKPANQATPKLTITRGVKVQPEWIVVFGPPGIGKSTLAANAPSPLFLDLEEGTAQIDCARVEGIKTWDELMGTLRALVADTQGFETLVIDTLDKAEWLCQQKVCASSGKKSLEDFNYGKGYTAAYEEFRRFIATLQELRAKRGMRCIILAHAKVGKVPNTSGGPDYDRWELKVDKRVGGVFFEAADAVLYAHHDVAVTKKDEQRASAFSTGKRLLGTEESPAFMAKNRFGLPPVMPLSWGELSEAIGRGNSPSLLIASIRRRATGLTDPERRAALERSLVQHATNYPKLIEIDTWLATNLVQPPPTPAGQTAANADAQPQQTPEAAE